MLFDNKLCSATFLFNYVYNNKTKAKYLGLNRLLNSQICCFVTNIVVAYLTNLSFLATFTLVGEINHISYYYPLTFLTSDYYITKQGNLVTKIPNQDMYNM